MADIIVLIPVMITLGRRFQFVCNNRTFFSLRSFSTQDDFFTEERIAALAEETKIVKIDDVKDLEKEFSEEEYEYDGRLNDRRTDDYETENLMTVSCFFHY